MKKSSMFGSFVAQQKFVSFTEKLFRRGGGRVAFYSNDLSSKPIEVNNFRIKIFIEKDPNKHGLAQLKTFQAKQIFVPYFSK